ncbi:MAG: rhodanese-like domain-containing protein [Bacteroidales bacterium]
MTKSKILFLSVICALLIVTSCQKEEVSVNEAKVLVEYMEGSSNPLGKHYASTDMPSLISATELNSLNLLDQAYIIDIRSSADFGNGHIENAVQVDPANLLSHMETADLSGIEKIAIVCYSGQTAAWATTLLRIMGYGNVFSLKFGMASWNDNFATPWVNATENGNTYAAFFETTNHPKAEAGELPELNTGGKTGEEILESRMAAVLAEGFNPVKITAQTVFTNPDDYYIVCYWPASHYSDPGHIPGAIQYTPKESIKFSTDLLTLPTDKPIVIYCYTGQGSAFLSAYLRLLGYDAKSLLYGANGMAYDMVVSSNLSKFSSADIMDYNYVTN